MLDKIPVGKRFKRILSSMAPPITATACSGNVLATIGSTILPSLQMLRGALKQGCSSYREVMMKGEIALATFPHGGTAIKATAVLANEGGVTTLLDGILFDGHCASSES